MRQPFRTNIVGARFPKSAEIVPMRLSATQNNQGLNITLPKAALGLSWFYELDNMVYERGTLQTRYGLVQLGDSEIGYGRCVGLTEFTTSFGFSYLIAFYPTTIRFWNGSAWATADGSYTFTGTEDDFFTWTGFDDKLVFSNGIDGTFRFDPVDGSITQIVEAPAAYHLTTFAGRLIASNVRDPNLHPSSIRWSVKGNEEDWDGIGSGEESLLSTPGGTIDQQTGVFPISDYNALVVRSNSVWMMTASGNVEVPFTFERLFANFGSKYRHSLQTIPAGVIGIFNDNVYIVSEREIQPIGEPIVAGLPIPANSTVEGQTTRLVTSAYSQSSKEYIILPNSSVIGSGIFYRYSMESQKWARADGQSVRWAAYSSASEYGLTIDSSTGNIEDAGSESIDSEVASVGDEFQDTLVLWTEGSVSSSLQFADTFTDAGTPDLALHTPSDSPNPFGWVDGTYVLSQTFFVSGNSIRLPFISGLPVRYAVNIMDTSPSSPDYTVSADCTFPSVTNSTWLLGLSARGAADGSECYRVCLTDNGDELRLTKIDNLGASMRSDTVLFDITPGVAYNLYLQVDGDQIVAGVDGVPLITWTDTTYTAAGVAGVYGIKDLDGGTGNATMDNFQVNVPNSSGDGEIVVESRFTLSSLDSDIRFGYIPGRNAQERINLTKMYLLYEMLAASGSVTFEASSDLGPAVLSTTEPLFDTTLTGPRMLSITVPCVGRNVAGYLRVHSGTFVKILDISLDVIPGTDTDTWTAQ